MPRNIPVGNGDMLVAFDDLYRIRDLYWPHVGQPNPRADICNALVFGPTDNLRGWIVQVGRAVFLQAQHAAHRSALAQRASWFGVAVPRRG